VTRTMQLSGGSTITARCTPIMTGARPVGALIEVKLTARSPAASRPRGKVTVAPKQSRATVQFERELADMVRSPASRILVEGEPGSGRMSTARRIHGLRCPGTKLAVYPGGLAQVQGGPVWLAELARLLSDESVTVTVTNLELLDERTHQGLADLLDGQPGPRLVLMTCAAMTENRRAASTVCDSILQVPALRQRREDIPELVQRILRASDVTVRVGHRAMVALTNYAWPGNMPQLERVVKHAAKTCRGADIGVEHLGTEISASAHGRKTLTRLESLERDAIVDALRECGGNKIKTAVALGMSRSTLYRRLRSFGLEPGRTVL
jgi:transcriptional regulator of acetoin/glycerol metabolism